MAGAAASVVITGIGLRSSVGNHAAQTAASVRAGINSFAEWPYSGSHTNHEPTPPNGLTVAAVQPALPNGPWYGKIPALLTEPAQEALWNAELLNPASRPSANGPFRIAGWLSVPYADRVPWAADARQAFVTSDLPRLFGPGRAMATEMVEADHAGGIMALARAVDALRHNQADACMVCGVDSYLHDTHLRALKVAKRLKSPARTSGLVPGEAGAAIVLEREADARARKVRPLARVAAVALDQGTLPLGDSKPSRSAGMSRAVRQALMGAGGPRLFQRVLVDLNGERSRFLEWALVETRCLGALPAGWELWHPADSLGDIGAAFAPAGLALAARALARSEAGSGVLVCASSQKGERGVAALLPLTG